MFDCSVEEWTLKNDAELRAYLDEFQKSFIGKCEQMQESCETLNKNSEKAINTIRNLEVMLTSMSNRKFVDMNIQEDNELLLKKKKKARDTVSVDTMENVLSSLKEAARKGIEITGTKQKTYEDLPVFIGSVEFFSTSYQQKTELLPPDKELPVITDGDSAKLRTEKIFNNSEKTFIETSVGRRVTSVANQNTDRFNEVNAKESSKFLESISQFVANGVPVDPVDPVVATSNASDASCKTSETSENLHATKTKEEPFSEKLEHLFQNKLMNVASKAEAVVEKKSDDVSHVTRPSVSGLENTIAVPDDTHHSFATGNHESNLVDTIVEKERSNPRKKGLFDSDSEEEEVFQQFSKVLEKMKTPNMSQLDKPAVAQPSVALEQSPSESEMKPSSGNVGSIHDSLDTFIVVAKSRTKGPPRKPPARTTKAKAQLEDCDKEEVNCITKTSISGKEESVTKIVATSSSKRTQIVKSIFESESEDELFASSAPSGKKTPMTHEAVKELPHNETKEMAPRKQTRQAVKNIFESDSEEDLDLFRKKQ